MVGLAILHPNRAGVQLEKCHLDQGAQRLARIAAPAGRGKQHEPCLGAAFVTRRRTQRAQADAAPRIALGNDEKPQCAGFARGCDRGAQARCCLCRGHGFADMTHGLCIAIELAKQREVARGERAQAQPRGEDHARARSSLARRRSVFTSVSSFNAGGITVVSAGSIAASARLRNAMRWMCGAWIGKVAAR